MKKVCKLFVLLSMVTVGSQAATKSARHTVKKGDTLYEIAHKNHISVSSLKKVNGIKSGKSLKLGKVLKIPGQSQTIAKKKKTKTRVTKRQDRKLASAIKNVNFKQAKHKKSTKFSINDIISNKRNSKKSMKMINLAKNKLGRRYVWGAIGKKNTFDCSGLTSYVCKKNGISIPRRAIQQSKFGKYVSRKNLKPGDLIFFDTSKKRKGYVNHVGIYIGNNKFIHASSAKKKVVITSLNKTFYSQRFKGGRRVAS